MNTAPLATDSLETWLNYWSHVHVTGIDLGLERVIPVAEKLGVTHPDAKVFTVAGTNGKGSTTTTLAAILNAQGYQVGLYQSPHIYRFNERVKLGGVEVDDQRPQAEQRQRARVLECVHKAIAAPVLSERERPG